MTSRGLPPLFGAPWERGGTNPEPSEVELAQRLTGVMTGLDARVKTLLQDLRKEEDWMQKLKMGLRGDARETVDSVIGNIQGAADKLWEATKFLSVKVQ